MNQQLIDKLLHKAGAYFGAEGTDYSGFSSSKFAELILQEIIEELEADVIDMDDDPDDYERGYDNGVKSSVAHIKEHFGVE